MIIFSEISFFLCFSGSRSSDGADIGINEKMSPCKLSEFTSPSLGTSNNSFPLLKNENVSIILKVLVDVCNSVFIKR